MSALSFSYYVTGPGDMNHSRITDLEVIDVGGTLHLYSGTRYDGVLRQWDIADGPLAIGDSQSFAGGVIAGATGGIAPLSLGNDAGILVGGGTGGALQTITLLPNGEFGASTALGGLPSSFDGFQHGATIALGDGSQAVFGTLAGTVGLARIRFTSDGTLRDQTILQDTQIETTVRITATAVTSIDGQDYVVTTSGQQNGITARAIDSKGQVTSTQTIGADESLWISSPTALEIAQVGTGTYAVLAASGTDSLSVIEIGADGSLNVRDHILDARETRFGGVTSLKIIEAEGKTYVIAGGADDGISVFLLLEGGFLVHRATIEDTVASGLDNVSAIAAAERAAGIDIFVSSSSETGVTQLRFDTGEAGVTKTATLAGGLLSGTDGGDILQGHNGDDVIQAGRGDDILRDGLGQDVLSGGKGADLFILAADGQEDTITDFTVGEDKIDLSLWPMLRSISQLFITLQEDGMRIVYGDEVLNVESADGTAIDYRALQTTDLIGASRLPVGIAPGYPGPATPTPTPGEPPANPPADQSGPNNMLTPLQMIQSDSFDVLRNMITSTSTGSSESTVINGRDTAETLEGTNGSDLIFAGGGNDVVQGNAGDDTVFGRDGDDTLLGGQGADTLFGGNGADIIDGGLGQDMLYGGGGADTFIFNSGTDQIADFEQGIDQIVLDPSLWTGLTSAADVLFYYGDIADGRATIDFENGNVLIVDGITDPTAFADDISLF